MLAENIMIVVLGLGCAVIFIGIPFLMLVSFFQSIFTRGQKTSSWDTMSEAEREQIRKDDEATREWAQQQWEKEKDAERDRKWSEEWDRKNGR